MPVFYNKGILTLLALKTASFTIFFPLLPPFYSPIRSVCLGRKLVASLCSDGLQPFVPSSAQLWGRRLTNVLPIVLRMSNFQTWRRVIIRLLFGRETWIARSLLLNFFFFLNQSCSGSLPIF